MTSIWTLADHAARNAIEAEMRRRGSDTAEALREALRLAGQAVSVKALTLMGRDSSGQELADFVRQTIPA